MTQAQKLIYADEQLVIIDKASGILSIPDRYDPDAPVALALLEPEFGQLFVVHRIDKDTSGILVFARDAETHRTLSGQFASRTVEKTYFAIVLGRPVEDAWDCDEPLLADADRTHRTVVDRRRGKPSSSHFEVIERFREHGYLRIKPETGRTHQVRVHCASTGYPILADPLYGDGEPLLLSKLKRRWKGDEFEERPLVSRTALHAAKISFIHPKTQETLVFEAPLPKDMTAALSQLRKVSPVPGMGD